MKTLLLTGFCLLCFTASKSQISNNSFNITLKSINGETFIAEQQGLRQTQLPFSNGKYSGKLNGPALLTLANQNQVLTIYAQPGIDLTIVKKQKDGHAYYRFPGKGSAENAFLAALNKVQQKYLPVDGDLLTDKANMMSPVDFSKRLKQYQAVSKQMLSTHDFDPEFTELQKAYVDCKVNVYALQYFENYGVNAEKKKIYLEKLSNGDASLSDPATKQAWLNQVYPKEMTFNDRKIIAPLLYNGVDMNNETLFKYSSMYSNLVIGAVNAMAGTGVYHNPTFAKRRIECIKHDISNNYIKQQLLNKYKADI